jgi:paraquat-inducible protein B
MSDLDDVPPAVAVPPRRMRISLVWIVPIIAALAAGGIALQRILSEGPTITVLFESSPGIEAGKTFVKYKDVTIGQVTAVQLSSDHGKVEVTAKIAKSAAHLMVEDAQFWVVRPRVSLGEVSGLNTLLSGNYIGFEAGKSTTEQHHFTGLEVPRVGAGAEGREFLLKAKDAGGLGPGAPVYFHRLAVGQVVTSDLAADGKAVDVKVFINEPYDKFVFRTTRFWNAGGLNVSLGAGGLDVRTASVSALLAGGLEFDTPPSGNNPEPAAAEEEFVLYRDRAEANKQPHPGAKRFVIHFAESLHGLSIGAPVTFLGLPAGEVTDVGLEHDSASGIFRPRVEVALFPERVSELLPSGQRRGWAEMSEGAHRAMLRQLVDRRGLRAQLRSENLLSGQQYVAIDYFPKAPRATVDLSREIPELPATSSPLPDLEAKLASVLAKLDEVPFQAIGADLRKALSSLDRTLQETSKMVNHVDGEVVPRFVTALEDARKTLASAERVMNSVDRGLVGPDAPAQQELRNALQEVTQAARALRVLADSLERHPESLIRGRTAQKE